MVEHVARRPRMGVVRAECQLADAPYDPEARRLVRTTDTFLRLLRSVIGAHVWALPSRLTAYASSRRRLQKATPRRRIWT
jgi:hypothetical protein